MDTQRTDRLRRRSDVLNRRQNLRTGYGDCDDFPRSMRRTPQPFRSSYGGGAAPVVTMGTGQELQQNADSGNDNHPIQVSVDRLQARLEARRNARSPPNFSRPASLMLDHSQTPQRYPQYGTNMLSTEPSNGVSVSPAQAEGTTTSAVAGDPDNLRQLFSGHLGTQIPRDNSNIPPQPVRRSSTSSATTSSSGQASNRPRSVITEQPHVQLTQGDRPRIWRLGNSSEGLDRAPYADLLEPQISDLLQEPGSIRPHLHGMGMSHDSPGHFDYPEPMFGYHPNRPPPPRVNPPQRPQSLHSDLEPPIPTSFRAAAEMSRPQEQHPWMARNRLHQVQLAQLYQVEAAMLDNNMPQRLSPSENLGVNQVFGRRHHIVPTAPSPPPLAPTTSLDKQPGRPEPLEPHDMKIDCECKVCYGQIADTLLMPCAHLIVCRWCADQIGARTKAQAVRYAPPVHCPMCRVEVLDRITVFRG